MPAFQERIAEGVRKAIYDPQLQGAFALLGAGRIFWVCQSTNTGYYTELVANHPAYSDGVPSVYTTIQAALDACVANRNDFVLVMPDSSDYDLTAALTMTKRDVHLIGVDFLIHPWEIGANSAVKLHQTGDYDVITLTGGNCEIAGFYFKNYNNQGSVVCTGAVADYAHVHHNHFNMNATTTSGVAQVDFSGATSSFATIERNTFATNVSDLTFASLIDIPSSCTWARVWKNNFMIGDGCTCTIVIKNLSYKGQTNDNDICTANGGGGATSTITNAITIGGGVAFGNRIATVNTTTTDLAGGGSYSFVENYNGVNGGSLATAS